jgi:hypothetical protein
MACRETRSLKRPVRMNPLVVIAFVGSQAHAPDEEYEQHAAA